MQREGFYCFPPKQMRAVTVYLSGAGLVIAKCYRTVDAALSFVEKELAN